MSAAAYGSESLFGQIQDHLNNPLHDVKVRVQDHSRLLSEVYTDANGLFHIQDLPKGHFTLIAMKPPYQMALVGISSGEVTLALQPKSCILFGNTGESSHVRLYKGYVLLDEKESDESGNFSFEGLPEDTFFVTAFSYDSQTSSLGAITHYDHPTELHFALSHHGAMLQGSVKNIHKDPIPDASISVLDGPVLVAHAISDAKGHYTLTNLPEGYHTLLVEAADYQNGVQGFDKESEIDLVLQYFPGTLCGRVVDAVTKEPLHALVSTQDGIATLTDAEGLFFFSHLAPGTYTLTASMGHFQSQTLTSQIFPQKRTDLQFLLERNPGIISGLVLQEQDGTAIASASIAAFSGGVQVAQTLSDSSGFYRFENLPWGLYQIVAKAPKFQSLSKKAKSLPAGMITLNLPLSIAPGGIAGMVQGVSQIVQIQLSANGSPITTLYTNQEGGFFIDHLQPGIYTVTASCQNFQIETQEIIVYPETTSEMAFTLKIHPGSIKGIVCDEEAHLLPGTFLSCFYNDHLVFSSSTDDQGRFLIQNLKPGSYLLRAEKSDFFQKELAFTILPGEETDCSLTLISQKIKVFGTLVSETEKKPLPRITFKILFQGREVDSVTTDDSGHFEFYTLPGNFEILFLTFKIPFKIERGSTITTLAVPFLEPPLHFYGKTVVDHFLNVDDPIHILQWSSSPSNEVTHYILYRNGTPIARIPAKSKPTYYVHNQKIGEAVTYSIAASNTHLESEKLTLQLTSELS